MAKKEVAKADKATQSKELRLAQTLLTALQQAAEMNSQVRDFLVGQREKALDEYNRAVAAELEVAKAKDAAPAEVVGNGGGERKKAEVVAR